MSLQIKFQKVFDVPVSPDDISNGTTSIVSYNAITGDYIININVGMKTYTFNLKGIPESKANEIIEYCDTNAEILALGQMDLTNPQGNGSFTYRNAICVPISYEDGGTLDVSGTTKTYSTFNVTVLTNIVVASV